MKQVELIYLKRKFYITAKDDVLIRVSWVKNEDVPLTDLCDDQESKTIQRAIEQLDEYFEGKRVDFSLPLCIQGTSFQKQVWDALLTIPYGYTSSYTELAKKIKNPKAVRAVGTANGANQFCIIIPCHRIITKNGDVGGYLGGSDIKVDLLELEKRVQLQIN